MNEAFKFWMMKAAAEITTGLMFVALVVLAGFIIMLPGLIRQWRCRHPDAWESRDCSAICTHCGKNLGFIGEWRARRKP